MILCISNCSSFQFQMFLQNMIMRNKEHTAIEIRHIHFSSILIFQDLLILTM